MRQSREHSAVPHSRRTCSLWSTARCLQDVLGFGKIGRGTHGAVKLAVATVCTHSLGWCVGCTRVVNKAPVAVASWRCQVHVLGSVKSWTPHTNQIPRTTTLPTATGSHENTTHSHIGCISQVRTNVAEEYSGGRVVVYESLPITHISL